MKGNYFLLYVYKNEWTDKEGKEVVTYKYYFLDAEGEITVRSSQKNFGVEVPEQVLGQLPRVTATLKEQTYNGQSRIVLSDLKRI